MENVHAERSAGWSVLCYVALLIVATLLTNGMPSLSDRPAQAALGIDTHRFNLIAAAWLTFPASAFFLWFLVGLRTYLSNAPGRQEGLATFALIAGVVMVSMSLWAAALLTAAAYPSPDLFRAYGVTGVFDTYFFAQGGLGFAPVAIFVFASAHSMRRHERAPAWLAWLGYLAAFGAAIATLSIFVDDSVLAPAQPGPQFFGAIPCGVWFVATGLVLILQKSRGSDASSTSEAS